MNVIISNKKQEMLSTLNIDVIKSLNGVFTVDEIVNQFQNFFFQRMILDITAIKDYEDVTVLQKLSISLDMDKVILVLNDSGDTSNSEYLSNSNFIDLFISKETIYFYLNIKCYN